MAKKTKECPACQKQISDDAKECPECKKTLEILHWEIELGSGEKLLFFEPTAEETIREHLVDRKLNLSNRCRQFIKSLARVEAGQDHYETTKELEWKTLRDYADKVFSLQVLYNPVQAYGKLAARITWIASGIIVAIVWNTEMLLANDAGIVGAILWSIVLLLTSPTIIGVGIVSFIVSRVYDLPPFAMAFRTFIGILVGAIAGAVIGWTAGYLIGVFIGLSKGKFLHNAEMT